MREALAQVKLEQGADAVILGNKKVPGGVEIISAVDFDHRQVDAYTGNPALSLSAEPDQSAVTGGDAGPVVKLRSAVVSQASMPEFLLEQGDSGRKEPILGMAPPVALPGSSRVADEVGGHAQTGDSEAPSTAVITRPDFQRRGRQAKRSLPVEQEARLRARQVNQPADTGRGEDEHAGRAAREPQPGIDEVRSELKNLRELMQSQLHILEWERYSQRHPVRSVLLNLMTQLGLGTDVCEHIFNDLDEFGEDPHKVWRQAMGLLAKSVPIGGDDILERGGRIALVGSTGVGKTTTIAKLAARYAHHYGKHAVGLISTDTFRVGAQDQLQHFARMLEIPLLTAGNADELADRLNMFGDKQLVLIDTAGMSQTDVRLYQQFRDLQEGSSQIEPYLVLSANTQLAALDATVQRFDDTHLAGAIVTKIDESSSLGGIITASIRHQLPLVYCSDGQRVPEDLHQAKNHRLVSKAVSLMKDCAERSNKETLAFRYNHLISNQPN
jgi:flagellar biosynthesis protein FlhF